MRPLRLERIILNTIPAIEADGSCKPYIQIFKYAKLLKSTASKLSDVPSYSRSDSAVFAVNTVVEGDILVRVRHAGADGSRISVMRFTFHTGFIRDLSLRVFKADIDGACNDSRCSDDFHIDLVFAETDGAMDKPLDSAEFWKDMSKRQEETPRAATIPNRVSLFDGEGVGGSDEEKKVDDIDDIDAYISSLGVDEHSDTDELLAELQANGNNATTTDLDAEIAGLLGET